MHSSSQNIQAIIHCRMYLYVVSMYEAILLNKLTNTNQLKFVIVIVKTHVQHQPPALVVPVSMLKWPPIRDQ